jgi:hypothetical protein
MSEKGYEKGLVSACIQDTEFLERAVRAKVKPTHFTDKDCGIVYRIASELLEQGSEVNESTLCQSVSLLQEFEDRHKRVLVSKIRDMANSDVDTKNFSHNVMVEKRRVLDFTRELLSITDKISSGRVTADELEADFARASKAGSNKGEELDVVEYNTVERWRDRVVERQAISNSMEQDGTGYLRITDTMAYLRPYFPLGLPPQTITGVSGMTGVGKSHMMNAFAFMAIQPENCCNVLYFISENRRIETESRLDAVLLERTYIELYAGAGRDPFAEAMFAKQKSEWGRLFTCKVTVTQFDAQTIEVAVDMMKEKFGVRPDVIVIDSPDHMEPVFSGGKGTLHWQRKSAVYNEIKSLADRMDVPVITSIPQPSSTEGKNDVSSADVAGSYDISKMVDNLIMFLHSAADDLLSRRRIKVTKIRGAATDGKIIPLRLRNDLRFVEWEELTEATDEPIRAQENETMRRFTIVPDDIEEE